MEKTHAETKIEKQIEGNPPIDGPLNTACKLMQLYIVKDGH